MSAKETRKWAAQLVGYIYDSNGYVWESMSADGQGFNRKSNADLAEAVRVKAQGILTLDQRTRHYMDRRIGKTWFEDGPLAFIQAVREVVE